MKFLFGIFLLLLVAIFCMVKSDYLELDQIPKDKNEKCVRSSEIPLSAENKTVILNYIIDWKPTQTVDISVRYII